MMIYSFCIEVGGLPDDAADDLLYDAGCDDGAVHRGDGKLFVSFDREATGYDDAVRSAVENIKSAGGHIVAVGRYTGGAPEMEPWKE